ncbi:hypothetical protein [Flavobacterium cerinum]|uniref:SMI1/KNR4 family protein n=1 Tax=Flavobacterium cerinum TaxID=2502784 RepID=A0ABY5INQ0_9FLAO|nr:hypothetical protein [Flavobacterium cerinum]UUC44475.1 hypothetical protein NOX80_12635 [Flavobacterium cerinum]
MNSDLLDQIAYLKDCKGIQGSKFENLGQRVYDKIKNIIQDPNLFITHLYIPKGSEENAQMLAAQYKQLFNKEIDPELASFYQCFDGFEFRYINPSQVWEEYDKDEIVDWDQFDVDPENLSYADMIKNEEYEDEVRDEFHAMIGLDFEEPAFNNRMSDSDKVKEFVFYGESAIEFPDSGIRTLIPPAVHLFAEGNKVKHQPDSINVFYFDYFDFWSQTVLGKKENTIAIYAGTDYSASIDNWEFNDAASFLQKRLIK